MAVVAASGLQMTLPPWAALAAARPGGLALAGLLSLTNATFAVLLVGDLAHGGGPRSAAALLLAGGALWTANVLIFALWYW